jgi:hypothetical protein
MSNRDVMGVSSHGRTDQRARNDVDALRKLDGKKQNFPGQMGPEGEGGGIPEVIGSKAAYCEWQASKLYNDNVGKKHNYKDNIFPFQM